MNFFSPKSLLFVAKLAKNRPKMPKCARKTNFVANILTPALNGGRPIVETGGKVVDSVKIRLTKRKVIIMVTKKLNKVNLQQG